jgi:hypothetical protein
MPFYLQRVRLTVHTKQQAFAGTNSTVKLCYKIEEKHNHPKLEPGVYDEVLDHPWHDDFKAGKADSYEVNFGTGRAGKNYLGRPVLNGVAFDKLEDVRTMKFHLRIEGSDQWVFDRLALGGFFMEVRPVPGAEDEENPGEFEEVELGWLELAKQKGDVSMSADSNEGVQEYPIKLNGSLA